MKRRPGIAGAIGLLLICAVAYVAWQPSRVIWGTLTGDAFYAGYPSRYWDRELSGDPSAQARARDQLEQAGESALPVLRDLLRKGTSSEVRWAAIELIVKLGLAAHTAGDDLVAATRDPDSHVRAVAAKAIPKIETPAAKGVPALVQMLDSEHASVVAQALSVYRGDARPALTALVALLRDQSRDGETRWNAARTIGKMGADGLEALPVLIEFTRDPDDLVREHAAEAIGDIGPAAADGVPALIGCLDDQVMRVRRDAVRSLGQIGPAARAAVPQIKPMLNDPEELVRKAARKALELIAPEELPPDIEPPADADQETKRHAAGPSA